ncbi:hypothetical protein ACKFKF_01900 [Phormidesmis sp. 146-12]
MYDVYVFSVIVLLTSRCDRALMVDPLMVCAISSQRFCEVRSRSDCRSLNDFVRSLYHFSRYRSLSDSVRSRSIVDRSMVLRSRLIVDRLMVYAIALLFLRMTIAGWFVRSRLIVDRLMVCAIA